MITVRGPTIVSVLPAAAGDTADYDLRGRTVLRGLVDAHVHLGWYINSRGALHRASDGDTPEQAILAGAGNAYTTLMAGVTTVQSVGGREDVPLREAIERGEIPGPRVLSSIVQLSDTRLSPDSLRARVRQLKEGGAHVATLFASAGSLRQTRWP
jgi:imidazolonepropionase-like amidohydrolase